MIITGFNETTTQRQGFHFAPSLPSPCQIANKTSKRQIDTHPNGQRYNAFFSICQLIRPVETKLTSLRLQWRFQLGYHSAHRCGIVGILLEDQSLSLRGEGERGPFGGAGQFVLVGVGRANKGELCFWLYIIMGMREVNGTQYAMSSSLNAVSVAFKPVNTTDPLGLQIQ